MLTDGKSQGRVPEVTGMPMTAKLSGTDMNS